LNLVLANQFMTQLTDKIREAILGNVGTIMCGRIGVTDAEIMQKAFQPVFNAEDLHKIPNHQAVTTVLMFGLPTSPFTLNLLPPLGESSHELMLRMKEYALSRFGRPRAEVEAEIDERLAAKEEPKPQKPADEVKPVAPAMTAGAVAGGAAANVVAKKSAAKPTSAPKKNFLDSWLEKKAALENQAKVQAKQIAQQNKSVAQAAKPIEKPQATVASTPVATPAPQVAKAPVSQATKAPVQPALKPVTQPVAKPMTQQPVAQPIQPAAQPTVQQPVAQTAQPVQTVVAAEEMIAHTTGSVWAARAAQNMVAAAQQAPADQTMIKIHHDPKKRRVLMDGGPKVIEQTRHLAPTSHGRALDPTTQ
jgi:hypothetical protein